MDITLFKAKITDMLNKFKLIKTLVDTIDDSTFKDIKEKIRTEQLYLPLLDPTAFMNTPRKFYTEISDMVKLLTQIKEFDLHLFIKEF